jgi:hypothetical protein
MDSGPQPALCPDRLSATNVLGDPERGVAEFPGLAQPWREATSCHTACHRRAVRPTRTAAALRVGAASAMATGGNLRVARAALALAAAALLAACVAAQMPPGAFGGSRPTFTAVKSDLPYIRCGVCEALAKNAYRQVKTAREALRPGKKVRARGRCCAGPACPLPPGVQVAREARLPGQGVRGERPPYGTCVSLLCTCLGTPGPSFGPALDACLPGEPVERVPSRRCRLLLGTVCTLLCCTSSSAAWLRHTAQLLEVTARTRRGAASPTLAAAKGGRAASAPAPCDRAERGRARGGGARAPPDAVSSPRSCRRAPSRT